MIDCLKAWLSVDTASYLSNVITIFGLPVAAIALVLSVRQLYLSQRTGSVATVMAINDSLRESWVDYLKATTDSEKSIHFGEICNILELACTVSFDHVLYGKSGKLLKTHILNLLNLISDHDSLREDFLGLLQDHTTFEYIRIFLHKNKKKLVRLRVAVDPPAIADGL